MCQKRFILLPDESKALLTVSSTDAGFVVVADASTEGKKVKTFKHSELVGKTVDFGLRYPAPTSSSSRRLSRQPRRRRSPWRSRCRTRTARTSDRHGSARPGKRLSATKPR